MAEKSASHYKEHERAPGKGKRANDAERKKWEETGEKPRNTHYTARVIHIK